VKFTRPPLTSCMRRPRSVVPPPLFWDHLNQLVNADRDHLPYTNHSSDMDCLANFSSHPTLLIKHHCTYYHHLSLTDSHPLFLSHTLSNFTSCIYSPPYGIAFSWASPTIQMSKKINKITAQINHKLRKLWLYVLLFGGCSPLR
jgi:hypothetical protein